MPTLADTYHLTCRKGVWYYRRRVPAEYVELFGSHVVQRSLATKNKAEAKRLRTFHDLEFEARIASGRSSGDSTGRASAGAEPTMSKSLLLEYVRQHVAVHDRKARHEFAVSADPTPEELGERRQIADEDLSVLQNLENPNAIQAVQATARRIAKAADIDTAAPSFPGPEFEGMVRKALVELAGRHLARLQGGTGVAFIDALFDPNRPPELSISALAEQGLAKSEEEAKARRYSQQGQDKVRANTNLIVELVGPDRLIGSISYDDCIRVRSLLAQIPSNRSKF